jgi:hypothetical protein
MLTIFNGSNAHIIILEFRARQDDKNRTKFDF